MIIAVNEMIQVVTESEPNKLHRDKIWICADPDSYMSKLIKGRVDFKIISEVS